MGGLDYLVSLDKDLPQEELHLDQYIYRVKEKALRRRVIREAQMIQERAQVETESPDDLIAAGANSFHRLQAERTRRKNLMLKKQLLIGPFPENAWRGVFADYRHAMDGTTEACDAAHFATLWASVAVALGRNVSMFSGDTVYPNVYLSVFGPSGDKKTTAEQQINFPVGCWRITRW